MILCHICGIFPSFVTEAGIERQTACYPCYFWHILGKKSDAYKWLEYQKIAGLSEEVEKWYEANRQDNTMCGQV